MSSKSVYSKTIKNAPDKIQTSGCSRGSAKLTTDRLSLPLFMFTRNNLVVDQAAALRKSLEKKKKLYTSSCSRESPTVRTATQKHFEHLVGLYEPTAICAAKEFPNSIPRAENKRWQLPPNIYDVMKEPYADKKGKLGAYIDKLHETKRRPPKADPNKFYITPSEEPIKKPCPKRECVTNKGVFLSNARTRIATERALIKVKAFCSKDKNDPGPEKYYPKNFIMTENLSKPVVTERFNPHNFYRYSSVPESLNHLNIPRNISFEPGPGRFEARYHCGCPCTRKGIPYMPEQERIIEREMRNKFRRMPYIKRLNCHICSPEWRHVKGGGWRYLFKNITPKPVYRFPMPAQKPGKDPLTMNADARYYSLIKNPPSRKSLSFRKQPLPKKPIRIHFNSTQKPKAAHGRANKKLGFGSGSARFPDMERPRALTPAQVKALLAKIPPERRIKNLPTMTKDLKDIRGKLNATPKYMAQAQVPRNKPHFKFQPMPETKLLVKDEDILPNVKEGYFKKQLEVKQYYKNEYKNEAEKKADQSTYSYVPGFTFGRLLHKSWAAQWDN